MVPKSILELSPVEDGVFVDNLMVCSADRLLATRYRQVEDDITFNDPEVITLLFSHDLLNMSALVESVVCHEKLYINAEYIDRWNSNIQDSTLQSLDDIIVPVFWPEEKRKEAEDELRQIGLSVESGLYGLADLIFRATHHGFRHEDYRTRLVERKFFTPYEEGSSPWGTPFYIGIGLGLGFYLLSSQILGIPYKPSALRAQMLSGVIGNVYRSRRFNAADIAISLLEKSRETVVNEYFNKLLELNVIEAHLPCVLSSILKESKSSADVMLIAKQIRESDEGKAFRRWSADFSFTIQNGDLGKIGEFVKELERVTTNVNKLLGLTSNDNISLKLGWGPVGVGYSFSLPKVLKRPIYFKRHLWFLHNMYTGMAVMARLSDHIERVLIESLPEQFQVALQRNINWHSIQQQVER